MPKPKKHKRKAKPSPKTLKQRSKKELVQILKSRGVTQFQKGLTKADLIYNLQYVHRQGKVSYSKSKSSRKNDIMILRNTSGSPEEVYKKVADYGYQEEIQSMITKYHPVKGAGYKAPKMVIVIITALMQTGEKKVFSEASAHDMVVNYDNTFKMLLNYIQKSRGFVAKEYDVRLVKIVGLALKFIY